MNVAEFAFTLPKKAPGRFSSQQALALLDEILVDQIELLDVAFLWLTAQIRLAVPELSVGDGFALATASVLEVPVWTADRAFAKARDFARIELIR